LVTALVLGSAVQMAGEPGLDHALSSGLATSSNKTGEETSSAERRMSTGTVRQIQAILAAKARRTSAQRKVSSQLLEAQGVALGMSPRDGTGGRQALRTNTLEELVMVDI